MTSIDTFPVGLPAFRDDLQRFLSYFLFLLMVGLLLAVSWGQLPLMAVAGDSMEPTYAAGDAIVVTSADTGDIREGDVVVVRVPSAAQYQYGYPETIVHRVVDVDRTGGGLTFQTKGDNTGADPFVVRPENVRGAVAYHVPFVGYLLLYLQSVQGRIFVGFTGLVYLSYYTAPRLRRELETQLRDLLSDAQSSADSRRAADERLHGVEMRLGHLDSSMSEVDQSLAHFAEAMDEYATHLQSHTRAVEQMGDAAEDIQAAVEYQTRVLSQQVEEVTTRPSHDGDAERTTSAKTRRRWPQIPDTRGENSGRNGTATTDSNGDVDGGVRPSGLATSGLESNGTDGNQDSPSERGEARGTPPSENDPEKDPLWAGRDVEVETSESASVETDEFIWVGEE